MNFADKFRKNIGAPRTYSIGYGENAQEFVFKPIPAKHFGDQMTLQKGLARAYQGAKKLYDLFEERDGSLKRKESVSDAEFNAAQKAAIEADLDSLEYSLALQLLFVMVRNSYPQSEYQLSDQEVEMFCTANFQQLLEAFIDLNTNAKYAAEEVARMQQMKQKVNQGEATKA